ncbi:MAG: RNA methyltransferase [Deltaproteobacteria bacterium]|nr:RNA methyltransferase [Deltaproteobacteria bacterium]
MLDNFSVTLVEPQGSLNIGMVARAMKNCGINKLKLVNPVKYNQTEAYRMACFAKDVVDGAGFFTDLKDALADETCSVAFTRRLSKTRKPHYELEEIAPVLAKRVKKGRVALVFGREDDGLTNDELYQCDFRVHIPTFEPYGSLNLAQAVLIACYEIFRKSYNLKLDKADMFVDQKELRPMLASLDDMLIKIGYDDDGGKLRKKIMQAFKEICGRSGLRRKDVNMFLGIWSRVRKSIVK